MFDNLLSSPKSPIEDIFADTEAGAPVRSPSTPPTGATPPPAAPGQSSPLSSPSSFSMSPSSSPSPIPQPPSFMAGISRDLSVPPPLMPLEPGDHGSKKWLWIVVIILVVGAGGAGAYWWFSKSASNKGVEVNTNTPTTLSTNNNNTSININNEMPPEARDYDGDGLSDSEEVQQGTFVDNPDSDSDGLTDGEEVKFWYTNPLNPDSDGDGYLDGEEINHGYDPNNSTKGAKLLQLPNQELNMEGINNIIKDIDNSTVVDCGKAIAFVSASENMYSSDEASVKAYQCFLQNFELCQQAKISLAVDSRYPDKYVDFQIHSSNSGLCQVSGLGIDLQTGSQRNVICDISKTYLDQYYTLSGQNNQELVSKPYLKSYLLATLVLSKGVGSTFTLPDGTVEKVICK